MDKIWIILAVLSFAGGLTYLFFRLRKLDHAIETELSRHSDADDEDTGGYPEESVVE